MHFNIVFVTICIKIYFMANLSDFQDAQTNKYEMKNIIEKYCVHYCTLENNQICLLPIVVFLKDHGSQSQFFGTN